MKPFKCEYCSKFYDAEKYDICPHCKKQNKATEESFVDTKKKSEKSHFFGFSKRVKTEKRETALIFEEESKDIEVQEEEEISEPENKDKYEDVWSNDSDKVQESVSENDCTDEPRENIRNTVSNNLREAIQQSNSMQKTVAFYNLPNENEPVVGWLVCVKGEYIGESFTLKSGNNNIGRSLNMDIALAREKTVSRERHASIVYEPNKMEFFIQAGSSSGLTYVNDELVMTFKSLEVYDRINLGEGAFVFIPLCGENFNWDQYIEK